MNGMSPRRSDLNIEKIRRINQVKNLSNLAVSTQQSINTKRSNQHAGGPGSQDNIKFASNIRERSLKTSQKTGPLPHEAEVFNGFKERLKENLMLEQARSLNKEDAIA